MGEVLRDLNEVYDLFLKREVPNLLKHIIKDEKKLLFSVEFVSSLNPVASIKVKL
jgi:hypothetical protein